MKLNLAGDGVIENLYHYLWAKDALFNSGPHILLADTVIYKYGKPTFWYFTGRDGTVMRKSKKNVTSQAIEKSFTKSCKKDDIVACLYTTTKTFSK